MNTTALKARRRWATPQVTNSKATADTAKGSGPVRLRSVLQLLATGDSWRIAAFDSRTGPPK